MFFLSMCEIMSSNNKWRLSDTQHGGTFGLCRIVVYLTLHSRKLGNVTPSTYVSGTIVQ